MNIKYIFVPLNGFIQSFLNQLNILISHTTMIVKFKLKYILHFIKKIMC